MRRNTSRVAMHHAVLSLCTSRSMEGVFEELNGAHPLDELDAAGSGRDERRREVRNLNTRAGRRIAFVCAREDRARTLSTAQLKHEVSEAAALVLTEAARLAAGRVQRRRWLNIALAALRAARARLAARNAEPATARRERVETNAAESWAAADLAPTTGAGPEPPGLAEFPESLMRRANLAARPTVERLARTLTLAPGAPSAAVCV